MCNGRVKEVVDVDLSFHYSNVPSTESCSFFLGTKNLHSSMVFMLSCSSLLQGTSPIFNIHNFDLAYNMPYQILKSHLSYLICRGVVKGSRAILFCRDKISKYRLSPLTNFSYNSINRFTVSVFRSLNSTRYEALVGPF